VPAQGTREQIRRRQDRPGERDEGRQRDEHDHREPDQGEGRHHQGDERPNEHDGGQPFEAITHVITFLV
jgi:hypothetical protein